MVLRVIAKRSLWRHQHTTCRQMSSGREITIPVPWGVIAGREWGEEGGTPWLGIHGWLDNAGSFKPWARDHLPAGIRLICIDYPGHGLSSHLTKGHTYHLLESLSYIQRIVRHLGWQKFGLIGHSMGAGMCSIYAATFPEHVQALVMLDLIKPSSRGVHELVEKTRMSVQSQFDVEAKLEGVPEKVFPTYEAAMTRLLDGYNFMNGEGSLTETSAMVLLERGLRRTPCGGFSYTRDLRHRMPSLYGLPPEFLKEYASKIQCPHLLVKASEGDTYDLEDVNTSILQTYNQHNPLYQYLEVVGSHHVHLNQPELIAPIINSFLEKNKLI